MLRYLNMFVLIGIILVVASIIGFATGNRFLTEPGQPTSPQASLVYLGAGLLMLINGVVSTRQAAAMRKQQPAETKASDSNKSQTSSAAQ